MQDDCKTKTRKWRIRFSKESRDAIVLEYLTTGISQVELAEKYEERVASKKRESTLDKLQEKSRDHAVRDIGERPLMRGGEAL